MHDDQRAAMMAHLTGTTTLDSLSHRDALDGQAALDEANNEVARLREANAQMEAALLWLVDASLAPTVDAAVENADDGDPWTYSVTPIIQGCHLTPFLVRVEGARIAQVDDELRYDVGEVIWDAVYLEDGTRADDNNAARFHLDWYAGDLLTAVERDLRGEVLP